jgi:uncharacterized protein YjbI with pentapeptide repeats
MANNEHLDVLHKGAKEWNDYSEKQRFEFPRYPDLSNADLHGLDLIGVDLTKALLSGCNLCGADFSHSILRGAKLDGAELSSTKFIGADLRKADLSNARLTLADMQSACLESALLISADMWGVKLAQAKMHKAELARASIWQADLRGAQMTHTNLWRASFVKSNLQEVDLSGSDMRLASFSEVDLTGAIITDCYVYGTSAWNLELDHTTQRNLLITDSLEGSITVDNLEVAQFIYMLTNNKKIRHLIDTITSKAVLILGRFTPERKTVLDALRAKLRDHDYVSIIFDFEKPSCRTLTETVSTLAHMARFVIADITDAKSISQELQSIVPDNPSLPVRPLILSSQYEYAMFKDFLNYPWVLVPYRYNSLEELLVSLEDEVIAPAINKAREIEARRRAIEQEMTR